MKVLDAIEVVRRSNPGLADEMLSIFGTMLPEASPDTIRTCISELEKLTAGDAEIPGALSIIRVNLQVKEMLVSELVKKSIGWDRRFHVE